LTTSDSIDVLTDINIYPNISYDSAEKIFSFTSFVLPGEYSISIKITNVQGSADFTLALNFIVEHRPSSILIKSANADRDFIAGTQMLTEQQYDVSADVFYVDTVPSRANKMVDWALEPVDGATPIPNGVFIKSASQVDKPAEFPGDDDA
jgi:hypothetical protein